VVLFRTKAAVPALQRAVTNSSWDHVGILVFTDRMSLVCSAADSYECGFIECDWNGCRYYPVRSYVGQQWHLQYDEIALRQLHWEGRGREDTLLKLRQWCASVLGKPYQLPLSKLLDHFGSPKATDAPKGDEPGSEAVQKGFFCSELLAHAWKAIDILPAQHPASGFWPRDFGAAATHRLRLQHGASLGDELPLDFCTPGVASLLRIPTFSRAPPDGVDDAVASDDSSSAGAASDEY